MSAAPRGVKGDPLGMGGGLGPGAVFMAIQYCRFPPAEVVEEAPRLGDREEAHSSARQLHTAMAHSSTPPTTAPTTTPMSTVVFREDDPWTIFPGAVSMTGMVGRRVGDGDGAGVCNSMIEKLIMRLDAVALVKEGEAATSKLTKEPEAQAERTLADTPSKALVASPLAFTSAMAVHVTTTPRFKLPLLALGENRPWAGEISGDGVRDRSDGTGCTSP